MNNSNSQSPVSLSIIDRFVGLFLGKDLLGRHFPFLISLYKWCINTFRKGESKIYIPSVDLTYIVKNQDTGVGLYLKTQRKYEPVQTNLFLKTLKKNDTFIDVGANIGYYSLIAAKKLGAEGNVVAIEPDATSLNLLKRNIELNQLDCTVSYINEAISSQQKAVSYHHDAHSPSNSFIVKQGGGNLIQTKTLEEIVASLNLTHINLIKIDVEGAECDCLKSGQKILKAQNDVKLFIECYPAALTRYSDSLQTLLNTIRDSGFVIRSIINEFTGTVEPFTETKLAETLQRFTYVSLFATHQT